MRIPLALSLSLLVACGADPKPKPAHPAKNTLFVSQLVQGLGDPEIVVTNDSDVTLELTLQGVVQAKLEVAPHTTASVRVKAGAYSYRAAGADIVPFDGGQAFDADHRYAFRFFVVTKPSDDPVFVGKGWHCFGVPGSVVAYVCGRTAASCNEARVQPGMPGAPPNGPCEPMAVVFRFAESGTDRGLFAPTAQHCETLRAAYQKQFPTLTLTPCEEKK